jgi:DUF1680 family protein
LYVNFYAQSEGEVTLAGIPVKIAQTTDYPWNGKIKIAVTPSAPKRFSVRVRIPGWAQGRPVPFDLYEYDEPTPSAWSVQVNGVAEQSQPEQGYVTITREWRTGDTVELNLPMPVRAVHGNAQLSATRDRIAFERGPIVYCVEAVNREHVPEDLTVVAKARVETEFRPDLLGGVRVLLIDGGVERGPITAIPYYSWNNRGLAPMAVWLKRAAVSAARNGP